MQSPFVLSALLLTALQSPEAARSTPRYAIFEFGFHGPTWSTAFRINDSLVASGSYGAAGDFVQAFVGARSHFEMLAPVQGYGRAIGVEIDAHERVLLRAWHGQIYQFGIGQHVGLWQRNAGAVDLHDAFMGELGRSGFGGVAPDKSDVQRANDHGEFCGWLSLGTTYGDPTVGRYAAYRADFVQRTLDVLPVPRELPPSFADAWAHGIDATGDVVGDAFERFIDPPWVYFRPSAVAWIGGDAVSVGSPDPSALEYSSLVDIDDAGRAIGWARSNLVNPFGTRAFAWHSTSGRFEWLAPVAGYSGSSPVSCAPGLAVGQSVRWNAALGLAEFAPTLWDGAVAHDIAEFLPSASPWTIVGLRQLDAHGRILADAHHALTPLESSDVLLVPHSGLEVAVAQVGLVGYTNLVRVSGATPGAKVELLIGYAPTIEPLGGCSDPNAIVGVSRIALKLDPVTADAHGRAQFAFLAPPEFGNANAIYYQALEPASCRTGDVQRNFFF